MGNQWHWIVQPGNSLCCRREWVGKESWERWPLRQLLNRLITHRLIVQEGKGWDWMSCQKSRKWLMSSQGWRFGKNWWKDIWGNIKADWEGVIGIYKSSTQEMEVTSVFFEKEEGAKAFAKASSQENHLWPGQEFLSEKTAARVEAGEYLRLKRWPRKLLQWFPRWRWGHQSHRAFLNRGLWFWNSKTFAIRKTLRYYNRQEGTLKNKKI